MTHPPLRHGRSLVPPGEQCCVWMSAGILTYQLCDRQLDCENCPLDAALRAHFSRGGVSAAGAGVPAPPQTSSLPKDRLYSRRHCWVKTDDGRRPASARIGLEPGLAAALVRLHGVVPPLRAEVVERDRVHFWMVAEGGTFPLAAPVGGRLRATNEALADHPHLVIDRPLDDGWLYELELNGKDSAGLLRPEQAAEAYAQDARRFRGELAAALREATPAGPTLSDGGALLGDLPQILGPQRYFALLWWVYG